MKNMPEGFKPNSNAWTAVFPETITNLVFAQFAVQSEDREAGAPLFERIRHSFSLPNGPKHLDRATSTDLAGKTNQIWMAYWESPETYSAWREQEEVQAWFGGVDVAENANIGFWREVLTVPTTHFETIHSGDNKDNGVSHFVDLELTLLHEYWGGMRDRMKASEADDLHSPFGDQLPSPITRETYGKNIQVTAPDHIAFIRTAQDWTKCGEEERTTYTEMVQPTLEQANEFLRSEPVEAGCISSRLLHEQTLQGESVQKTCVNAYFLSMAHLEAWSKSHPKW